MIDRGTKRERWSEIDSWSEIDRWSERLNEIEGQGETDVYNMERY